MIGANVASEVILAFTLQTFARALGYNVGFAEVLLITVSVRVLAGIVPIPGGIGVAEGGLAFGLVRAGLPDEVAFAVVVLYRLATFYLPPVWGFFSLRWLERKQTSVSFSARDRADSLVSQQTPLAFPLPFG